MTTETPVERISRLATRPWRPSWRDALPLASLAARLRIPGDDAATMTARAVDLVQEARAAILKLNKADDEAA